MFDIVLLKKIKNMLLCFCYCKTYEIKFYWFDIKLYVLVLVRIITLNCAPDVAQYYSTLEQVHI